MVNVLVENLKEKKIPRGSCPFCSSWVELVLAGGQNPLAYFPPGRGRQPVTRVPSGDAQVQVFASEVLF